MSWSMSLEDNPQYQARWNRRSNGRFTHDVQTACAAWDHDRFYYEAKHDVVVAESRGGSLEVRTSYSTFHRMFVTEWHLGKRYMGQGFQHEVQSEDFANAIAVHEEKAASIIAPLDIEDQLRTDGCGEALMDGAI